ncbi:MAG: methylated-DNA--[protein]-cysteine S-methyltransferase [Gammaproteobacteria bacterium]|nr:methylated-DNA--[protein]-cysteine S-methyltransferase [Gammaproteobacteria bacterium]
MAEWFAESFLNMKAFVLLTPIGPLTLWTKNECLVSIDFGQTAPVAVMQEFEKKIAQQIEAYFLRQSKTFDLPYLANGTEFQKKVWQAMLLIPYGETRSYQDLAKTLNTSARAIGNACRRNPLPLVIPCHRVVAKSGLGGFSGETEGQMLAIKKILLDLEQTHTALVV